MVEKLKKAIEPFYTDLCTVYEKRAVTKEGRTQFETVLKFENVPCRVSSKAFLFGDKVASENDNTLKVSKKTKIFLPPEYVINEGSQIEVNSKGRKCIYAKSGKMSFYTSHNEVMVDLMKDYA